ncbi:uncharacterized protein LOC122560980 [Chiloscyllium plagiosum]|uniref:uncharacterized protein LOC122560980 n=1 Tax=Chiloscyllium plagiosum TaxID=36176 RepID=UPI001CB855BB|nr:uncharacterized protein LOC122560980 [Chiloscyllium plagiosum]
MFTAREWQRIKSGYRGPEDLYPLRHVGIREWGRGFTLPDSAVLGANIDVLQPGRHTEFSITNLIHVTDSNGAQGILNDQCLKKAKVKQIGEELKVLFSWWSIQVSPQEVDREKEVRRNIIEEQLRQTIQEPLPQNVRCLQETLLKQYISSPAFLEQSYYGNFKFTYNINDLIGEYKKSVCQGKDPVFSVLGTFRYNIEIMHTVAVHPPGVRIFEQCPHLPSEVISQEGTKWVWRPESTGSEIRVLKQNDSGSWWVDDCYPDCRRWEFVSFAFYLPDENPEFPVRLEFKHLTVCDMEESQRFRPPHTYMTREEAENQLLRWRTRQL